MANSPNQALADARKLVRTFSSAPDPRRRAQEILSVLKRAEGWGASASREIAATDTWLQGHPSVLELPDRLRATLVRLEGQAGGRR